MEQIRICSGSAPYVFTRPLSPRSPQPRRRRTAASTQRGTRPGDQQFPPGTGKELCLHIVPRHKPNRNKTIADRATNRNRLLRLQQQGHAFGRNTICNHSVSFLYIIDIKLTEIFALCPILLKKFGFFHAKNMEIL